jgi:hypothetical protein
MTTTQMLQPATQRAHTSINHYRAAAVVATLLTIILGGCGTLKEVRRAEPPTPPQRETTVPAPTRSATQQRLIDEANALAGLAGTDLGKEFLRATEVLPAVAPRTVFRDDNSREYFSPNEAAVLSEERRKKLASIELDEYRYYYTKYGSPLAYLRALELAGGHGLTGLGGANILDFGYGSIGHLRLLASLGANVVGVDPDSYLDALYSETSDQGPVTAARPVYRGAAGSITLAHGRWPTTPAIAQKVTGKGPYQLIVSKNTLKRGYLKPERRAPKNQLIELGVTDDAFLKAAYDALAPGGLFVIYNLAPKQAATDKPYLPHADARSPFSAEQFARAGLEVVALNVDDHDFVRKMGAALGWDKNDQGEVVNDLSTNLFAIYTIVKRNK